MSIAPTNEVRILRSREELEAIIPAWMDATVHPQAHPEVFFRLCEADDVILRPHVPVLLNDDGSIRGMMVSRLEYSRFVRSGRYLPIPQPMAKSVIVPFDGIIGSHAAESAPELLLALLSSMDAGEADVVDLPFLPLEDPIRKSLLAMDNGRFRNGTANKNVHWHTDVADSFDEQLKTLGKSTRGTLRNNLNRFRRDFEDRFEIRLYDSNSDLDEMMDLSETVATKSYHRGLDVGFSKSIRERAVYEGAHAMGSMWARIILIDDKPAAFIHAFKWKRRLFGTYMGFDREFTKLPLGTIVLFESLRLMCEEDQIDTWDFGPGEAEYKSRICSRFDDEEQRTIFARTLRAQRIRATTIAFSRTEGAIKAILKKLDLETKVKTAMRNRVRAQPGPTDQNR
ncbi:MAG: GNAT family N-acetyltransferase [Phycisphaerales bacterium]|nr:GNAT family N-acetyltransferase [Phycisphaerales bacterium]